MKKNIILGVTGGIASYKAIELTSLLKKENYDVRAILTRNALEFIKELPFRVLSKNRVYTAMFDPLMSYDTDHIELAKWADIMVIYPATASILGKIYAGIADDLLSTVVFAMPEKIKIICPSMNTQMLENPILSRNIDYLASLNTYHFIEPVTKRLACGDVGKGGLCEARTVADYIKSLEAGTSHV